MTTSRRSPRQERSVVRLDRTPLFVILALIGGLSMAAPAAFAAIGGQADAAWAFAATGGIFAALSAILMLAVQSMPRGISARAQLSSLTGALAVLPAVFALPLLEVVGDLSFANAYFEMLSSLTTTGATIFDQPEALPDVVHLWRAQVAWMGGFLIWVAAIAVLAPLRLGGFEVLLTSAQLGRDASMGRSSIATRPISRVLRYAGDLAPVYLGLTFAAWLGLQFAGEAPFVALCHAMSALSTSGISPLTGFGQSTGGRGAEAVLALFLLFALSRTLFARDMPYRAQSLLQDRELRIAAAVLAVVPAAIFLHHWGAPRAADMVLGPTSALEIYWGGSFMTLSFLTTTGFVSADWEAARIWSGLTTPGLIFMGLALIGGGVATTAGGVKLLRVHVLYQHGQLEMARLVHPHLVGGPGHPERLSNRDSAYIAWLFFMIFALSVAGVMVALSLTGVEFETALVLTIACLSTTGPLTAMGGDEPIALALLPGPAQAILGIAMVLGRLETLAIVALLNPEFWRS